MSLGRILMTAVVLACGIAGSERVIAEVRLPSVLGSGMVLQREMEAPIWGWAEAGEGVSVTVGDTVLPEVKAGADGRWRVGAPPMKAGGPIRITVRGSNTLVLEDVLVGDLWVCSGQSNMQWTVSNSRDAQEEVQAAEYPAIRLFSVSRQPSDEPRGDCQGRWVACGPASVPGFSAVGYFFGRELHRELGVPIGLIHTSWGGTPAQAWTPQPALEAHADLVGYTRQRSDYVRNYPALKAKYEQDLARWQQAADEAKAQNKQPPGGKPRAPKPPDGNPNFASVLYNGMIHPIVPVGIKGAIWYQGESNAGHAYRYRTLLPTMIGSWRSAWGQGEFPFGIVQLANFMNAEDQPGDSAWAELREAQAMTAAGTPNCGLAVAIDIGQAGDIHPKNKQDVGKRLALWALARVYGREVAYSGPVYRAMKVQGSSIRLSFDHIAGGLVARGGEGLRGFAIAGEDRKFVWARATIDGDSVVVGSPDVPAPVAVRYAWANNPVCNLYNTADLPAVPFRTDDWPGVTAGK